MKKISKAIKLFLKYAEKVYNCRYCGAPHRAVDSSGFMCGQCGTTTYPLRDEKLKKEKEKAERIEKDIEKTETYFSEPGVADIKEKKDLPSHKEDYLIIYVTQRGDVLCNDCANEYKGKVGFKIIDNTYYDGIEIQCDCCGITI